MNISDKIIYLGYTKTCAPIPAETIEFIYADKSETLFSKLPRKIKRKIVGLGLANSSEFRDPEPIYNILDISRYVGHEKPPFFLVDYVPEDLEFNFSFVIYNDLRNGICCYSLMDQFKDYYVKLIDYEGHVIMKMKSRKDLGEMKERPTAYRLTPLYKNVAPSPKYISKQKYLHGLWDIVHHQKQEDYIRLTFQKILLGKTLK